MLGFSPSSTPTPPLVAASGFQTHPRLMSPAAGREQGMFGKAGGGGGGVAV